jgi:hypothetical protein
VWDDSYRGVVGGVFGSFQTDGSTPGTFQTQYTSSTGNEGPPLSLAKERAQSGEQLIGVDGGILLCTAGRTAAFPRCLPYPASNVALLF